MTNPTLLLFHLELYYLYIEMKENELSMTTEDAQRALRIIQKQFPKNERQLRSVSGTIPFDWFERNEADRREFMRVLELRVIFRGPRFNETRSFTKRSDATGVVLF